MKKMNIKALKQRTSALGKGGGDLIFYANKMKSDEPVDIRIIPPTYNLPDDIFFLERRVFWMDGKPYICPSTFGGNSPILDEIESIKKELEDNKEFDFLAEVKDILDSRDFQERSELWFLALILNFEYDGSEIINVWADDLYEDEAFDVRKKLIHKLKRDPDSTIDVKAVLQELYPNIKIEGTLGEEEPVIYEKIEKFIVGSRVKIFSSGVQMMQSINDELSERAMDNGKDLMGIDRCSGFNIQCKKTGVKWNEIEYKARHHAKPMEMPEKFYKESELPDMVKLTKDSIESDEYLRQVVRAFLLGDEMPPESESVRSKDKKEDNAPRKRRLRTTREEPKEEREEPKRRSRREEPKEEREEPKRRSKRQILKEREEPKEEREEPKRRSRREEPKEEREEREEPTIKSNGGSLQADLDKLNKLP